MTRELAAPGRSLARSIALGSALMVGMAFAPVASWAADSGPADGCEGKSNLSFGDRFLSVYSDHLKVEPTMDPPDPKTYNGVPPAVNNPPYPYSTWNMGGTPAIGYENMYYGALMDTIYCGPDGKAWKDSRVTVYGWLQPGANWSSSHTRFNFTSGTGGNFPAAYSYEPNTIQMDQIALYLERTPDMVQTDHWDYGYRFTGLWGTDYKYTYTNGILSNQYTKNAQPYGFDPVMMYFDFWFPKLIGDGVNIRAGRYISVPDIEAQLAPNNLTYSHSLLYSFDPYTYTGVTASAKLNKNVTVQLNANMGSDINPGDRIDGRPTFGACLNLVTNDGKIDSYSCLNQMNGGNFAYNNINQYVTTLYLKFNEKWHMDTEFWYMWETNVPNALFGTLGQNTGNAYWDKFYGANGLFSTSPFPNGQGAPFAAICNNSSVATCRASEYALVNYVEYQWTGRDFISIRNELFNDQQGQRTGFKTRYSEHMIGWTHWIGDTITIRPELRYEHAYDYNAFDNPTGYVDPTSASFNPTTGHRSQLMLAADMIIHF